MERNLESEGQPRPTADEARAALSQMGIDGEQLANRIVTPWWYHVGLGIIVAVMVGAQVLPGSLSVILTGVSVAGIPLLMLTYARTYGVTSTQPAGPRSRLWLFVAVGVLVLCMAAVLVVRLTASTPWWGVLAAVVAFAGTVVSGRRYDDALRDELAGRSGR
ncbi:MAG: hypothetical protein QM713_16495 [Arachnia sp.]